MIKKIIYIVIPAIITLSVAKAEPSYEAGSMLLSQSDMDRVVAGIDASASAWASISGRFAITATDTTTVAANNAAGGAAVAVAVGVGPKQTVAVATTTPSGGSGVVSFPVNFHATGPLLSVDVSAIATGVIR